MYAYTCACVSIYYLHQHADANTAKEMMFFWLKYQEGRTIKFIVAFSTSCQTGWCSSTSCCRALLCCSLLNLCQRRFSLAQISVLSTPVLLSSMMLLTPPSSLPLMTTSLQSVRLFPVLLSRAPQLLHHHIPSPLLLQLILSNTYTTTYHQFIFSNSCIITKHHSS